MSNYEERMTALQREAWRLLKSGASMKEAAQQMGKTPKDIKHYIGRAKVLVYRTIPRSDQEIINCFTHAAFTNAQIAPALQVIREEAAIRVGHTLAVLGVTTREAAIKLFLKRADLIRKAREADESEPTTPIPAPAVSSAPAAVL